MKFIVTYWPGTAAMPADQVKEFVRSGQARVATKTIEARNWKEAQSISFSLLSTSDGCLIEPTEVSVRPGDRVIQITWGTSDTQDVRFISTVLSPAHEKPGFYHVIWSGDAQPHYLADQEAIDLILQALEDGCSVDVEIAPEPTVVLGAVAGPIDGPMGPLSNDSIAQIGASLTALYDLARELSELQPAFSERLRIPLVSLNLALLGRAV